MPTQSSAATPSPSYQLKVTLRDSKPPIWRRLQVSGKTSLAKLHDILQIAMGWTNSHLHQFVVSEQVYSDPTFELEDTLNEKRITLEGLGLQPKMRFSYEYDMGDDWQHEVLVEKILDPEPGVRYSRCLTGKRACPPEDCGGIYGYYDLLEAVEDPHHPEHENLLDWLGTDFDPNAFDLEAVNAQLRTLK
jgi:hypothetical protein